MGRFRLPSANVMRACSPRPETGDWNGKVVRDATKTLLESDGGVVGHNLVQRTTVEPSRIHELGHPNLRTAAQAARGSYLGALVRKGCRRVSSVFVRRERATATSVGAASS